jgi:hypothetical protein
MQKKKVRIYKPKFQMGGAMQSPDYATDFQGQTYQDVLTSYADLQQMSEEEKLTLMSQFDALSETEKQQFISQITNKMISSANATQASTSAMYSNGGKIKETKKLIHKAIGGAAGQNMTADNIVGNRKQQIMNAIGANVARNYVDEAYKEAEEANTIQTYNPMMQQAFQMGGGTGFGSAFYGGMDPTSNPYLLDYETREANAEEARKNFGKSILDLGNYLDYAGTKVKVRGKMFGKQTPYVSTDPDKLTSNEAAETMFGLKYGGSLPRRANGGEEDELPVWASPQQKADYYGNAYTDFKPYKEISGEEYAGPDSQEVYDKVYDKANKYGTSSLTPEELDIYNNGSYLDSYIGKDGQTYDYVENPNNLYYDRYPFDIDANNEAARLGLLEDVYMGTPMYNSGDITSKDVELYNRILQNQPVEDNSLGDQSVTDETATDDASTTVADDTDTGGFFTGIQGDYIFKDGKIVGTVGGAQNNILNLPQGNYMFGDRGAIFTQEGAKQFAQSLQAIQPENVMMDKFKARSGPFGNKVKMTWDYTDGTGQANENLFDRAKGMFKGRGESEEPTPVMGSNFINRLKARAFANSSPERQARVADRQRRREDRRDFRNEGALSEEMFGGTQQMAIGGRAGKLVIKDKYSAPGLAYAGSLLTGMNALAADKEKVSEDESLYDVNRITPVLMDSRERNPMSRGLWGTGALIGEETPDLQPANYGYRFSQGSGNLLSGQSGYSPYGKYGGTYQTGGLVGDYAGNYQEGNHYYLDDNEIQEILKNGGSIEYL